jgi:hypothetical protein
MAKIGYGRVSTADQKPQLHLDALARQWAPFVYELERVRAQRARLPWRTDMLMKLNVERGEMSDTIDFSFIRFWPLRVELWVRPLDVFVTEPLF